MVDRKGTGGTRETYTLSKKLKNELIIFADKRVSERKKEEFLQNIEQGIEDYKTEIKWSADYPKGNRIKGEVEKFRDQIVEVQKLLDTIHLQSLGFIGNKYFEKFREESSLITHTMIKGKEIYLSNELKKMEMTCCELLPELELKQGRKSLNIERKLAERLYDTLRQNGNKQYALSSEPNSVLVKLLDIVLVELATNDSFGKTNYINNTQYSPHVAKSIARSYKNSLN